MPLNIPFKSATYHKHGGLVVDFGVIDHTNTATYARSEKWVHALRNVPFQDQGVPDDWYKSGGWCFVSHALTSTNNRLYHIPSYMWDCLKVMDQQYKEDPFQSMLLVVSRDALLHDVKVGTYDMQFVTFDFKYRGF